MLKGISPLIGPDLLKTLHEMGHGDDLVLADAHFPGHSLGKRTLRADGLAVPPLLEAIAPLFALEGLAMMQPNLPGELDPLLEAEYLAAIRKHAPATSTPERLPRQDFYTRSAAAFCILITGELRPYGNIILRKGVTL